MQSAQAVTPLLRPHQVEESHAELKRLEEMLAASQVIRGLNIDRREVAARKKRLKAQLQQLTPAPYRTEEKDAAVSRWNALAASIAEDMPSSEEMRRNPPGAREKHTEWNERHKHAVQEWKNIGLRLLAGGDMPNRSAGRGASISNVETLRQWRRHGDVSMDNAQIPKARDIHVMGDPASAVTFSDEEIATLTRINPALAESLAVLPSDARAGIKQLLATAMLPPPASSEEPARRPPGRPPVSATKRQPKQPSEWAEKVARLKAAGIRPWGLSRDQVNAAIAKLDAKDARGGIELPGDAVAAAAAG